MSYSSIVNQNQGRIIKIFKICVFLLTEILLSTPAVAQFYQFSQYYNSFQLLNPAFVGSSGHQFRFNLNTRLQWISIPQKAPVAYHSTALSGHWIFGHPNIENNDAKKRERADRNGYLALGMSLTDNNQGWSRFRNNSILISPSVILRLSDFTYLTSGLEVNVNQYRLNDYILVNDYLDGNLIVNDGFSESNFNLSTGLLLISKYFWTGISLKDVIPNPRSFATFLVNESQSPFNNLYLHGGANIPLSTAKHTYFTSSISLKKRYQNIQFEGGAGVSSTMYGDYEISASLAYRGIPRKVGELSNTDAFIAIGAISLPVGKKSNSGVRNDKGRFTISLSADVLHTQFQENLRTWELSLIFTSPSQRGKQYKNNCINLHGPLAEQLNYNFYSGQ